MQSTLLDLIDVINEQSDIAEINVMSAMCNSYQKSVMIYENTTEEVQESFKDDLKGPILGTKEESMGKRILMLIPRMIAKLIQLIKNLISKLRKKDKKCQQLSKEIDSILKNAQTIKGSEVEQMPEQDLRVGESYTFQEQPLPAVTDVDTREARYRDAKFSKQNTDKYSKERVWNPGQGLPIKGLYYNRDFSYVRLFDRITKPLWNYFKQSRYNVSRDVDKMDPNQLKAMLSQYEYIAGGHWENTVKRVEENNVHDAVGDYKSFAARFKNERTDHDYTLTPSQITTIKNEIANTTSEDELGSVLDRFQTDLERVMKIVNVPKELIPDTKWYKDPIEYGYSKKEWTQRLEKIINCLNGYVTNMNAAYTVFHSMREHDLTQIRDSLNTYISQ